jgi:CRISPR/Cas system-associated protein endoribonuclease Cas2
MYSDWKQYTACCKCHGMCEYVQRLKTIYSVLQMSRYVRVCTETENNIPGGANVTVCASMYRDWKQYTGCCKCYGMCEYIQRLKTIYRVVQMSRYVRVCTETENNIPGSVNVTVCASMYRDWKQYTGWCKCHGICEYVQRLKTIYRVLQMSRYVRVCTETENNIPGAANVTVCASMYRDWKQYTGWCKCYGMC